MYNYQNFVPRLDVTPRVKYPMVSSIYFAWCYQEKDEWHEGECFLHPKELATNIEDLEADRASKFELDYEKDYYKDHYAMLVVKYRKEDQQYTMYLTPEHAYKLLIVGLRASNDIKKFGTIKQPEYGWLELNLEGEQVEPVTRAIKEEE